MLTLPATGLAAAGPAATTANAAPSPDVVISEVYGGGGNSGATLTRDFIELGNRGSTATDLTGWSVQYLPGSPSASSRWQVTPLDGSVQPGARHLVAEARGAGGTTELPTPDDDGAITMAAASGTVALVTGTTPLTCLTLADCAADPAVHDLVGYGTATVREGNAAPRLDNTTSAARAATLTDTDDNAADFTAGAPTPVNSAGQGTGEEPEEPEEPVPGELRISDVQGSGRLSLYAGSVVERIPGVVTGVRTASPAGFWIQDPAPDADPATSEGVFVYTGSTTPTVAVGDSVLVTGTVSEYYPGGRGSGTQSMTELTSPRWTVLSSGNPLPAPVTLDAASVPDAYAPAPAEAGSTVNLETLPLEPSTYALDLYESLEGSLVQLVDAPVVGPTSEYGEVWVTVEPETNPTARGGTLYASYDDPNPGRMRVESVDGGRSTPVLNVGDALTGVTAGPLDYDNYGGYFVAATTLGAPTDGGLVRETTREQELTELAVASYNVENLGGDEAQEAFDRHAAAIVDNLAAPDILALEEIQDDDGATNSGTTGADLTLERLVTAIEAAGGPSYEWRQISPENNADGGEPGGNIRVAFLFNPERVSFTDRPGGDATTAVAVQGTGGDTRLSVSPGRIAPTEDAWSNSRKPLVGEFTFRGRTVFVIAVHFNSKGGDQPLYAHTQPPLRSSEEQRVAQAELVADFVAQLRQADPLANVVAAGDFNDYPFSPAVRTITADGGMENLMDTLPEQERYSYVYQGNSQTLDQVLVSPGVVSAEYDVVHINAEFADQASDHDPQVARIRPSTGDARWDRILTHVEQVMDRVARKLRERHGG
nr:endonuclease/exonuclease/phosphatase family protein [Allostreptomyces psammosilenae]